MEVLGFVVRVFFYINAMNIGGGGRSFSAFPFTVMMGWSMLLVHRRKKSNNHWRKKQECRDSREKGDSFA